MKFQCEKVSLLDRLTVVSSVVDSDAHSLLGAIQIEGHGGTLRLTAMSPTASIRTTMDATIEEEGHVLVPARFFTNLVKVASGPTLLLAREGTTVSITGGNSRLTSYIINELPTRQSFECGTEVARCEGEELAEALDRAPLAIDKTRESTSLWTGLRLKTDGEWATMTVTGCDGTRLMYCGSGAALAPYEATIPSRTAGILSRLAKRSAEVKVYGDDRRMLFEAGNFTLLSALIAGRYADVESILPDEEQVTTRVHLALFDYVAAMDRIKALCPRGTETPSLFMVANRLGLGLSIQTPSGELQETLNATVEGDTLETVQFLPNYVYDVSPFVNGDEVVLGFCAHKSNALYVSGEDWCYFAMPKGLPRP